MTLIELMKNHYKQALNDINKIDVTHDQLKMIFAGSLASSRAISGEDITVEEFLKGLKNLVENA